MVHGKLPNKIFDGNFVTENDFPYLVSVGTPHFGSCGGSILTREHILTSAHCVCIKKNIIEPDVSVLSGTNNLLDIVNGQIHDVALIILFDKYDPPRYLNDDIAILKVRMNLILIFEYTLHLFYFSNNNLNHIFFLSLLILLNLIYINVQFLCQALISFLMVNK